MTILKTAHFKRQYVRIQPLEKFLKYHTYFFHDQYPTAYQTVNGVQREILRGLTGLEEKRENWEAQ